MIKKDFITSIVLIVFSVTIIVQSYTMDRLERRGIDPFSAPGVVPGMVGGVLLCLAGILFIRSVKQEGFRVFHQTAADVDEKPHRGAATRVVLTLCLSLVYAIGCLGRFDYTVSTACYIFAFICLFEGRRDAPLRGQWKMILLAFIQAITASLLITFVFKNLFLVDLP